MPKVNEIQSSFASGELSPRLRGQAATEIVQRGLKRLENAHALSHGIVFGRNGMRRSGASADRLGQDSHKGVTFKFNVNRDLNYLVIIEPLTDTEILANGGTHETQIRVVSGDNLDSGTRETFEVRYTNVSSYADATASRTLYTRLELEDIHFLQIKDQMIFVHGSHPPMKLVRYKKSNGDIRWTFTYMGTWGAEWGSGYEELTTTVTQNEVATLVGYPRCIAYYQQRIVYGGMTNNPNRLVFTRADDITVIDTGLINTDTMPYNTYEAHFGGSKSAVRVIKLQGSHLDPSLITVLRNGKELSQGTGANQYQVFKYTDDFGTWPIHAQAAENLVEYFEYQSTYLSRVQVGRAAETYIQFGQNIDLNNNLIEVFAPRPEDSAFVFDIASTTQDFIQWIAAGDGLFVGTTGGEWVAAVDVYMSATNPPEFSEVSYYGSQHIQPITVGDAMIYVTASGRELRAFRSDFSGNFQRWDSIELNWGAEHLFQDYKIKQIAYSQTPDDVIWVLDHNGNLYSAVYDPNISPTAGWSRHPVEGEVRSITTIHDSLYDRLVWTIKRSGDTDQTHVEYENRDTEGLDNVRIYESGSDLTTIDLTGSAILGELTERYTSTQINICIKTDGAVEFFGTYDQLVATGRLSGSIYTMVDGGRFVEVGVAFTQLAQLSDREYGTSGNDRFNKRRLYRVGLDLIESQPPEVDGEKADNRSTTDLMGNLSPPIDGKLFYKATGSTNNRDAIISQSYPFRLQLAGVLTRYQVEAND